MIIKDALSGGKEALAEAGIENPSLDAALLLAEVLNVSRSSLIAAGNDQITNEKLAAFNGFIQRRIAGECTAYILGRKEFYGLEFLVTPAVLVPRPDTETLVETALKQLPGKKKPIRVLDLCTGSGAIAIALKHEMPELEVWAADISEEALAVAKANASRLLPEGATINFCCGDLYEALSPNPHTEAQRHGGTKKNENERTSSSLSSSVSPCLRENLFSIIIANAPYIPTNHIEGLSAEVQNEPHIALDGGDDGLSLIRNIIARAPEFLCPGGSILMEADPRQMKAITDLFKEACFADIQIHKDLSGNERVITAMSNEQ